MGPVQPPYPSCLSTQLSYSLILAKTIFILLSDNTLNALTKLPSISTTMMPLFIDIECLNVKDAVPLSIGE